MAWADSILHPSDFSEASQLAFAHALRIALGGSSKLELVHAQPGSRDAGWLEFPAVRATLERWGKLPAGSTQADVREAFGLLVDKVAVTRDGSPLQAILGYLTRHGVDLLVLATHGRNGLPRWLHRSVAEPLARRSKTSTLFVPADARGFVSVDDGSLSLSRILIPVDKHPGPDFALLNTVALAEALGVHVQVSVLHVGDRTSAPAIDAPESHSVRWERETRKGSVVDTILEAASEQSADLIVMTTAGHQGLLDALRGSSTERVLRHAPCPVLAVPAP